MSTYDIYTGWIVAFTDGQWRHARISPGYVTIADFWEPNRHRGVFRREDVLACKTGKMEDIQGWELATCPFMLTSSPVLRDDILSRIAFVRFGRAREHSPDAFHLVDSLDILQHEIGRNLDDLDGIDERWPRHLTPEMPNRWTRTALSLVFS